MNQLWIVVAVVAALLLFTRIRARRRAQPKRSPAAGPRIQGFQVQAYVHPHMSTACLYDNGVQFGRGFRRKEGPALPHDGACRCEAEPFSFTSSQVFNGALRHVGEVKSTVQGLASDDAVRLIERLKAVEAGPLPDDAQAYAAAVDVEAFPPPVHEALRGFLAERLAFLRARPREAPKLAEPVTTDGMETAKPT